jgi:photosystem II stability/assembly factor-like uncharacterized protein
VGSPSTSSAADTVIAATADGGARWQAQPLTFSVTPDLTGIDCPTVHDCMAVGSFGANPPIGAVLTTHDGGTTWHIAAAPDGALAVISVVCLSTAHCIVLVSDGTIIWSATSTDLGHTWVREGNLPAGLEDARDLSCTAAGTCLVAGNTATATGHGQGTVIISVDDGMTWTAADVPVNTGLLQDAWCASATKCLAVGTTSNTVSDVVPANGALLHSNDGGHTWTDDAASPPVNNIFGIDCPSALVCVMVGTKWVSHTSVGVGGVAQSVDGGDRFTASSTDYTPLTLTAVTCPSLHTCIAVGGDTVARIDMTGAPNRAFGSHRSTTNPDE